jgi:hypothetical protein
MIAAPAALTNAIEDALAHLGVRVTEQYLPPTRILELAGVIPVTPPPDAPAVSGRPVPVTSAASRLGRWISPERVSQLRESGARAVATARSGLKR